MLSVYVLAVCCLAVNAQLPNVGGGMPEPEENPLEDCPRMNRGRVNTHGYYILDEFNNRIFYKCNKDRTMTRMDCPAGFCAYYEKNKVRGHKNSNNVCNTPVSDPKCTGGYVIPPPQPLEACASQAIALGPDMPAPDQSTPCPTACVVEFNSFANILVRSCINPLEPMAPGCYGEPNAMKYVCDSNMCNVHPLEVIISQCENQWIAM